MYFGCATPGNQIKWASYAVLTTISIVLLIFWIVEINQKKTAYADCFESQGCWEIGDQWYCFNADYVNNYCENKMASLNSTVTALLVAWIVFIGLAKIPLYSMRFSEKPTDAPATGTPTNQRLPGYKALDI